MGKDVMEKNPHVEVPGSNPFPYMYIYLELILVVPSSTPQLSWVSSQLVSLLPVVILKM